MFCFEPTYQLLIKVLLHLSEASGPLGLAGDLLPSIAQIVL